MSHTCTIVFERLIKKFLIISQQIFLPFFHIKASAHLRAHRLIPSIQGSRRLPEVPQSRKPAQPS